MDYKKKIEEYHLRIKNRETLKFVEFLETLLEWVDRMYKLKRLSKELEKEVQQYMPKEIFKALDSISPEELTLESYDELKIILLREASELINAIVLIGNLKLHDFDLVQFNLSQIFKKEEIASMMELARTHLEGLISEHRAEEAEEREKKKKAEEEFLKKISSMPQKELNKLVINSMFDFTPSARTPKERISAIEHNQETILGQKKRFSKFERKLADATERARTDAQSMVYRQIRNVDKQMTKVKKSAAKSTQRFKEKSRELASAEGTKKQVEKARENITASQKRLQGEIKTKGTKWEEGFRAKTQEARSNILNAKANLSANQKLTHESITEKAKAEINGARGRVQAGKAGFADDVQLAKQKFYGKADEVLGKGQAELYKAKERMLEGKAGFEKDVEEAEQKFHGKAEEIGEAREDLLEKRELAREGFTRKGQAMETEARSVIHERKTDFESEREKAQLKFKQRAEEIKGHAVSHFAEKKEKLLIEKGGAQKRFLARAKEVKGGPSKQVKIPELKGKKELVAKAGEAKSRIKGEHKAMIEKAKLGREKMMQEIEHRKDLFLYDTRFARDRIKGHAKKFAEQAAAKREEFETRQGQIVARHKAHQKAHLIRNLLRTIRHMR